MKGGTNHTTAAETFKSHWTESKIIAENPELAENPLGAEYKYFKKRSSEEQLFGVC